MISAGAASTGLSAWEGGYLSLDELASTLAPDPDRPLAVVISGGGATGAYEAGALEALLAHGIVPDIILGTSVGALIAYAHLLQRLAGQVQEPDTSPHTHFWWETSRNPGGAEGIVDRPALIDALTGRGWHFGQLAAQIGGLLRGEINQGLFGHGPLLATAISFTRHVLDGTPLQVPAGQMDWRDPAVGEVGRRVVREWLGAKAAAESVPAFVCAGTNLTLQREALFCLADRERLRQLAEAGRWTFDLSGSIGEADLRRHPTLAALQPDDLLRALLISTSIPAVFPASRLAFRRWDGTDVARYEHLFTDGGIAVNSPLLAAVELGARRIVSLEVSPMVTHVPTEDPRDGTAAEAATASFFGILGLAVQHGLEVITQANKRCLADPACGEPVAVYRLAPHRFGAGIVDFAGHYEHGERELTLFDWFMQGYLDAAGRQHLDDPLVQLYQVSVARGEDEGEPLRQFVEHPGFWQASLQAGPAGLGLTAGEPLMTDSTPADF
jgi:predicted acylesterase/phospholipase RssA